MDIVSRARNIIVRPRIEWPIIDMEPASVGDLYAKYLVPLGLIGPIASFIGLTIIGVSVPFIGTYRTPVLGGLTSMIVSFAAVLIGVYVWALIINALAPTFSGRKNVVAALKVAVFAATPALLAGILSLLPVLGILQIVAALYGLYLLYCGLPVLMKVPPEKAFGYTALTIVCGFVVGIVFAALLTALHFTPFFGQTPQSLGRASDDAITQSAIAGAIGSAAGGSDDSKKAAATIAAGVVAAASQAEAAAHAGGDGAATRSTSAADTNSGTSAAEKNAGASAAAGIAAIGTLVGGGKAHVETADFHALKALLPEAVGTLSRTDARGEKSSTAGLGVSTAEGTYSDSGNGRLSVKISDMGNASGLMALGKLAFAVESESDSGFEKNVVIDGTKVHEKWTASGQSSELTEFVGDRFLLEVNGTGVPMTTAERAISAIPADKLVALGN